MAGGVSPGRSSGDPKRERAEVAASMWPGEYPPEGRDSAGRFTAAPAALQCGRGSIPRKVGTRTSSWMSGRTRFNVAGGVSPGRSSRRSGTASSSGTGFNVAGGVSPGRSTPAPATGPAEPSASMWPGEYPPEGRGTGWPTTATRSRFNVAGGVSPGRSLTRRDIMTGMDGFNVAGGVSPGRSTKTHPSPTRTAASMWPGEYPPEGRDRGRGDVRERRPASMWPGEYPPEGRDPVSPSLWAGAVPLQCGRGSIPRKVKVRPRWSAAQVPSFNVAGGVSPGRSKGVRFPVVVM